MPSEKTELPPNTQVLLPSEYAVLKGGFTRGPMVPFYATPSEAGHPVFSKISHSAPFVVVHPSFLDIVGEHPTLDVIAKSAGGSRFAHEAGVWIEETQEVIFTSNLLRDPNPRNQISRIRLDALTTGRDIYSSWDNITTTPHEVVTGNGATLFGKDVLVCSQGLGTAIPSSLTVMSPVPPFASYPILNNFHGRPFNSVNDVVILPAPSLDPSVPHPTTCRSDLHHLPHTTIWFTDVTYGYAQAYKPEPQLPNQVYCFNPTTGDVRVVADGMLMPNGLCFDWRGEKCYITDTGCATPKNDGSGVMKIDGSKGGCIYVYDVVRPPHGADLTAQGPTLYNRRVFAFSDGGAPDGIKCDQDGNVYSGCADGVQVWNKHGTLIGRIVVFPDVEEKNKPYSVANFNFCPDGKMFINAEDRIFVAQLSRNVKGAL